MPYVPGGLDDGRVAFRIGLKAPFVQFPKTLLGFCAGRRGWKSRHKGELAFIGVLCQGIVGAFLCNAWHFCATSGVCVLHSNLHRNYTAGCDSSKATYDPTLHETLELLTVVQQTYVNPRPLDVMQ